MNLNAYLPDDLGKRAKDANLPFSQLLRDAVVRELERREAMAQSLTKSRTVELELTDKKGYSYTGRFVGTLIDSDDLGREVYLTEDERVIFYDGDKEDYGIVEDAEAELRDWPEALSALGIKPVVDI